MKVIVIGSTGLTGRILVRRLLERGEDVTAFARNPASVIEKHERLHVAIGEARDGASLERAVSGQDAVMSAFGPHAIFQKTDIQEVFMRNLVDAMPKGGARRLVNLSAWGAAESKAVLTWFGRLFRNAAGAFFDDKDRGEAILLASDLEFVNVRPPRLTNGPERGETKVALMPDPKPWLPFLTREDLAAFMIEQLASDAWLRKSPLIWAT
jgi:uncharacterized protein YbjT (DUF2867 family)